MNVARQTIAIGLLVGLVAACSGRGFLPEQDAQVTPDGQSWPDAAPHPDGSPPPDGGPLPDGAPPDDGTVPTCGDDVIDPGENCDGAALGGATCGSLGHLGGALACTPGCAFDESGCTDAECGNGLLEGAEVCDGEVLDGQTCESLGFPGGTLGCTDACAWDTASCLGACQPASPDLACDAAITGNTGTDPDVTDVVDQWTGPGCRDFQMTGPERVYRLPSVASPQQWQIDVTGLTADLDLLVLASDDAGCRASLACVGWSGQPNTNPESLAVRVEPGRSYLVVLDGYGGVSGAYSLTVQCVDAEDCGDGQDNDEDGLVDCLDADCAAAPECFARQIYELFPTDNPAHEWDLDGVSVTFVPSAMAPDGFTWTAADGIGAYPTAPGSSPGATVITFPAADDGVEITLPLGRTFPFYGTSYPSLWVNPHGSLTFGAADPQFEESAAALIAGPPRIAPHWDRFDVLAGGTVTVDRLNDRIVVTWDQVEDPFYDGTHRFQAELWWTGQIRLTSLAHQGVDGLMGVSAGRGAQGAAEVNFYTGAAAPTAMGFHELFSGTPGNQIDLAGYRVVFTPDAQAAQGYTWALTGPHAALPFAAGAGNVATHAIAMTEDDASPEQALTAPHVVPFFGEDYAAFFVGANGYLTFASMDNSWTPDAANHYERPRISGLFADWSPQNGGTVQVDEFTSAGGYVAVATWTGVPLYQQPASTATFQVAIHESGVITLAWQATAPVTSVVGIASGANLAVPAETDFRP